MLDLAIQSDGKIIAVGGFTTYNGTTINYIARLNTNGSLDTGFSTGTGFNSSTSRVAIQSDGKIVVVGGFTSYNGTARNRIVRLNTDGTIDTSYNVGTGFDTIPSGGMRIQSDDKAVVCGGFTFYNGTSAIGIIRLNTDGTRDTSFNIGTGFNSLAVNKVGIQYDGKIVATGNYTSYNGTAVNRLIRLNTDGTIDTSLNIGTGFDGSTNGIGIVSNVNFQTNGRYVVIGGFANYNGVTTTRIIRITN